MRVSKTFKEINLLGFSSINDFLTQEKIYETFNIFWGSHLYPKWKKIFLLYKKEDKL